MDNKPRGLSQDARTWVDIYLERSDGLPEQHPMKGAWIRAAVAHLMAIGAEGVEAELAKLPDAGTGTPEEERLRALIEPTLTMLKGVEALTIKGFE